MTRAREKLIVIGNVKNLSRSAARWRAGTAEGRRLPPYRALSAGSYLDWMGMCLAFHPDGKIISDRAGADFKPYEEDSRFCINVCPVRTAGEYAPCKKCADEQEDAGSALPFLDMEYFKKECLGLPSKVTVTELKRRLSGEEEGEFNLYSPAGEIRRRRTALSAAEVGTAMHSVMEHLDFHGDVSPEGIRSAVSRLAAEGFLTEEETAGIDVSKIAAFFTSRAGNIVQGADRLEREVMFAVSAPAKKIGLGASDAPVLLQGIMDCVAIADGKITIIDYKTDRGISAEAAAKKYSMQLYCYCLAAERLYGMAVDRAYIYMFETGELAETLPNYLN